MNLYEAKTPLLGKGGGGSFKLPLESVRRLNEPPRLRPAEVLRDISLMGAATPPSPRRGIPAHSKSVFASTLLPQSKIALW